MTVLSICCIRGPCRLGLSDALACSISGVSCGFTDAEALAGKPRRLEDGFVAVREVRPVGQLLAQDGVTLLLDVDVREEVGPGDLLQVGLEAGRRHLRLEEGGRPGCTWRRPPG